MSFSFMDLAVESVLREGLTAIRRDPSVIDEIFAQLKDLFPQKYGQKELNRIKNFVLKKEIFVVHAFTQVVDSLPCISIQLMDDTENKSLARLEDFDDEVQTALDDEELEDYVKVSSIIPTSYDLVTGIVRVLDAVDLTNINVGYIYVDAAETEYIIQGGINNLAGQKQFMVTKGSNVDITDAGLIKSPIDYKQYTTRSVTHNEKLLLGIHTEERLLTLYIYTLVKYILLSRKLDLIKRHFKLTTLSGSDFTRNFDYGEPVFSRYLTISGIADSSWTADRIQPIDNVDVTVLVDKDIATTEDLNLEDMTVQINDDDN